MRILLLPSYFLPEGVASPYISWNRNKAFVDEGWDIIVYTPIPCRGISENLRKEYKSRKYERMLNGKMIIHRFNLIYEKKNPISRAFRYLIQNIKQFNRAVFYKDARSCNIMFVASTPPTQGAMAALVKKFTGKPFVYNLQDIFPDSLVGTGLAKKGGILWKVGRRIEDFTYRNADKIIVIFEAFKHNIMAKGVPEDKIEVIYNWVDENIVVNVGRKDNVLFDRYGLDRNKFYITYCGNIGLTQNMDMLLEVAKELSCETKIHFVLVGEGAYKKDVERIIKEKELENITLLPFQPYEEISHVFSLGDVGLIISKPGVGENSVPSKTWSIMSAERPVIANFDENELKTIIENNGCGVFTKAGDKDAFKQAILALYHDKEKGVEMGKNGRRFILQNLTKEIGTSKYVQVIKSFDKSNK